MGCGRGMCGGDWEVEKTPLPVLPQPNITVTHQFAKSGGIDFSLITTTNEKKKTHTNAI